MQARARERAAAPGGGLEEALAIIRTLLGPDSMATQTSEAAAPWIRSRVAGVLLLLPWAQRLEWGTRERFELAAIARQIAAIDEVDDAVALFAGCTGPFDHAGFAHFLGRADRKAIDDCAAVLVDAFRQRVRGFRNAPLDAVARQFLRKPGRFQIGERNVTVILDPSPFHVALRVSSLDEPVASLAWLDGRSLTFVLGEAA
jgi:hypothetical protein